ncbi:unnamed protein product, partial [Brachionus calyciflorus]
GSYLDDTIVLTDTTLEGLEAHKEAVMKVIEELDKRNLKVSLAKCVPVVKEIELLGNLISKNKIKPNPNRATRLKKRAKPITVQELQSWLVVANYYRKFIGNYAELARPLYELLGLKNVLSNLRKRNGAVNRKKVQLNFNEQATENFHRLRNILCSELVLALPNFEYQMYLSTDACDFGYGGVLEQEINGERRPIAYFQGVTQLLKRNILHFIVFTDHKPLIWIKDKTNTHQRLERWLLRLSNYDFEIMYKPGKDNIIADNFSRIPREDEYESSELDYLDNLVAVNQSHNTEPEIDFENFEGIDELFKKAGREAIEELQKCDLTNMVETKSTNPQTSKVVDEVGNLKDEQLKDDDIQWIK